MFKRFVFALVGLWLLFAIGTGWLSSEYLETRHMWRDAVIYECKDVEAAEKESCEGVKSVLQAGVTTKMNALDQWKSWIVLPFLVLSIALLVILARSAIARLRRRSGQVNGGPEPR